MEATLRRLVWIAFALGWMGLLFYLSSRSSLPVGAVEGGSDSSFALRKLGHFGAFGTLALFLRWGLGPWRCSFRVPLAALLLTVAYAIGDEVHQRFTPGRTGSPTDVGIDTAGAVVALGAWMAVERWREVVSAGRRLLLRGS